MSTDNHAPGTAGEHHFAHHFKNSDHEYQASKQGVWLFMATEILMFGAIFVGYIIFHTMYPEMFAEGAKFLDWRFGFVNTLVLIFSSYAMARSIAMAQKNDNPAAVRWMLTTIVCGAIFMCIKYMEYTHKIHLGLFPSNEMWGHASHGEEFPAIQHENLRLYFYFYFIMTGLHGIHVLVGMSLITWVMLRARKGEFSEKYYTPVEGVGIFWHIVDLIWIYLFPILYLIG